MCVESPDVAVRLLMLAANALEQLSSCYTLQCGSGCVLWALAAAVVTAAVVTAGWIEWSVS